MKTINIKHKSMNEKELEKEVVRLHKKFPKITLSLKEWREQRKNVLNTR